MTMKDQRMETNIMGKLKMMMFSKHLQGYSLEKAAESLNGMGIHSLDLTVRPGGHVEPENVETELPRMRDKLASMGISIGMLTTNIVDAADPVTESILKTASSLGVKYYKLGYYMYEGFGTLRKLRAEAKKRVEELAELNGEYGIHGGYHNHSENFIGASAWDIAEIISDTSPEAIGVYLDPAHLTVEGGSSGWTLGMDILSERITMLAVKDTHWLQGTSGYAGARKHSVEFCTLADGNTPWLDVLKILKDINFSGPVSMHSEYQGNHSFKDLTVPELLEQTAKDMELFARWAAEAGF